MFSLPRLVNSCLHNSLSQKYTHAGTKAHTCTSPSKRAPRRAGPTDSRLTPALRPNVFFFPPVVVCIIALGFISNQRWTDGPLGGGRARLFTRVRPSPPVATPLPATGSLPTLSRSASLETLVIRNVASTSTLERRKTQSVRHARGNFEFRSVMNARTGARYLPCLEQWTE